MMKEAFYFQFCFKQQRIGLKEAFRATLLVQVAGYLYR